MDVRQKLYLVERKADSWSSMYRTLKKATKARDCHKDNKLYEFEFKGEIG